MSSGMHRPPGAPASERFDRAAPPAATGWPRTRQLGVTLIELMVTLSIATLVLTIGISGLTTLVAENRRTSQVNTLVGNLNYARAEAVYRARTVVICPIDPDNLPKDRTNEPCATVTSPDGDKQWAQGYAVFVEDPVEWLRLQPGTKGVAIDSGNLTRFRFRDDGSANNGTIRICDSRDQAELDADRADDVVPPRVVVISDVGRVRVSDRAPAKSGTKDIDCSR